MSLIWLTICLLLHPPKVEVEVIDRIPVLITVIIRENDLDGPIKSVKPTVQVLPVAEFHKKFGPFTPQDLFELRWNRYIKEQVTLVEYLF